MKVSGKDQIDLDGRPVGIDELPARLAKMKSAGPITGRLAASADADPAFVKRIVDAFGVVDVQLSRGEAAATTQLSTVHLDQPKIDRLRARWKQAVEPRRNMR